MRNFIFSFVAAFVTMLVTAQIRWRNSVDLVGNLKFTLSIVD